jgi:hypothetical protein
VTVGGLDCAWKDFFDWEDRAALLGNDEPADCCAGIMVPGFVIGAAQADVDLIFWKGATRYRTRRNLLVIRNDLWNDERIDVRMDANNAAIGEWQ